jgi:hypothetical protein
MDCYCLSPPSLVLRSLDPFQGPETFLGLLTVLYFIYPLQPLLNSFYSYKHKKICFKAIGAWRNRLTSQIYVEEDMKLLRQISMCTHHQGKIQREKSLELVWVGIKQGRVLIGSECGKT